MMNKEKAIKVLLCKLSKSKPDLLVFNSGDFRVQIKDIKIYFNTRLEKRSVITKVFFNLFNAEKTESYVASNLLLQTAEYSEHFYLTEEERQNILSVLNELKLTTQSKVEKTLDEIISKCNGDKD